jgi:protocadherin Fat 4
MSTLTNNTITYSFQNNDGGRFAIDSTTGVVTVAGAIDREADGPSRSIIVRATSSDGSFTDQVFSIAINDLDEFDVGAVTDTNATTNNVDEKSLPLPLTLTQPQTRLPIACKITMADVSQSIASPA